MTAVGVLALAGLSSAAYLIPWSTVDSGGGRSTAVIGTSTWKLTGTIGQADATAGPASGGAYSLNGGYWAQVIQVPGGPVLSLSKQGPGSTLLSWAADAQGWQLQQSVTLGSWTNVGSVIAGSGNLTVPHDPAVPKKFYRLWKP